MVEPCPAKILNGKQYRCSFELALHVMGGKWKPIILYHLSLDDMMRFGQLRKSMPVITERMLTKQLRELEADLLVNRTVYAEVPPRVEYSLTTFGKTLIPILEHMKEWGEEYEAACKAEMSKLSENNEKIA
jgi:DNA-binding HxlR family transcriptional regulator